LQQEAKAMSANLVVGMTRKMSSSILKSKAPTSLMGAAKEMCQAPLFSAKTLAILGIQPTTMFHLATTLCANGGALEVMVRLEDTFVAHATPHPISQANCTEVSKVQLES